MSELKPCPFCHEDRDGYVVSIDKNGHVYYRYPDKLIFKFGMERRECTINFCPKCGRDLRRAE